MSDNLRRMQRKVLLARDYRQVFATPEGQRVLADILRAGGVTQPVYSTDTNSNFVNVGQHRLAMYIYRGAVSNEDMMLAQIAEAQKPQES